MKLLPLVPRESIQVRLTNEISTCSHMNNGSRYSQFTSVYAILISCCIRALSEMEKDEAAIETQQAVISASAALGHASLKEKQKVVITQFVSGRDVFAALSTGYGKSLCYGCLP